MPAATPCPRWLGSPGRTILDAPISPTTNLNWRQKTVLHQPWLRAGVRSSQSRTLNPTDPPSGKSSLPRKIHHRQDTTDPGQTLQQEDLQPRAIAILKAKNRLAADDAKLVEQAFAARMALQATTQHAGEEPASAPTDPSQPQQSMVPTVPVKRPRGRPESVVGPPPSFRRYG